MPRRDIDSELDAHRAVVAHYRNKGGYANAAETYDSCWKLREWRDRLQEPANANNTMADFARYVWDSIEAGTWDSSDWTRQLFRLMGKDMPPALRRRLMDDITPLIAARLIVTGNGSFYFTNQELIDLKSRMGGPTDGVYYKHPGRHFIDDIPDG